MSDVNTETTECCPSALFKVSFVALQISLCEGSIQLPDQKHERQDKLEIFPFLGEVN